MPFWQCCCAGSNATQILSTWRASVFAACPGPAAEAAQATSAHWEWATVNLRSCEEIVDHRILLCDDDWSARRNAEREARKSSRDYYARLWSFNWNWRLPPTREFYAIQLCGHHSLPRNLQYSIGFVRRFLAAQA